MNKLAVVFAGQGSQYQGMGQDFFERSNLYDQASRLLGYDAKAMISSGGDLLNETVYTQPLVFVTSVAIYEAFKELNVKPKGYLGFSLGEYGALYASGVYSFIDCLSLINRRATYMDAETKKYKGTMFALLGLNDDVIQETIDDLKSNIEIANYNSDVQTVISGPVTDMDLIIKTLKEKGLKRAIELKVSGAFHSKLMKEAAIKLSIDLKNIDKKTPSMPVYMNTTGEKLVIENLETLLENQVYQAVKFKQSINNMIKDGYTHFIEIGPGNVLSSLIKKINSEVVVTSIDKFEDIKNIEGWLIKHEFRK